MKRWISLAVLIATVGVLGPVPAAQAEVRVSPNHKLDSDPAPFRGRDQLALAVNPGNPQHVVAIYAEYLDSTCEATVSFDGGATWSPSFSLTPPALDFAKSCTNTIGLSPYVEFGSGNNVYTVATAQKLGPGFLEDASALVYKSTDGGATWGSGVVAMPGGPGAADAANTPGPAWYRPGLAVDPGAGTGGADRVILAGRDLRPTVKPCGTTCQPIRSAVSNDGGQTFSPPIDVTPVATNVQDFASKPVVHADHSVSVAWRKSGASGLIQVARSDTSVGSWGAPVDVTGVTNTGTPVASHVTPGPSSSASYPRMIKGPGNSVYLVYSQGSTGPTPPPGGYLGADHFISPDSQVWFQRSLDNGATWSTPKRISEQTTFPGSKTHQTRHPTISVSPNGRINIVWHDRRHWFQGPGERNCSHSHIFCEDIRLGDTYYSYSTNGGTSFSTPLRINDRSSNNEVGYDTRPSGYWWFGPQSATVGGDKMLIGWMDSREGNWDTDTEDIYLATVDFNATGAAPVTHVNAPDDVSRSVELSKLGYPAGGEGALVGGLRDPANPPGCTSAQCPSGPATRNATAVVIVNETDVAGALAGSVLARANPGSVLLSPAAGLPASVKAEVSRMRPGAAFVIGDTAKLSAQVISDLAAAGVPSGAITRLSGPGDPGTAAAIAARMDYRTDAEKTAETPPAFDAAVIANASSPGSTAAAALAAARRLPVLYVSSNSISTETQDALNSLDIDKTLVIGDTAAVSAGVAGSLPNPTRLGGADQYGVSQSVVDEAEARGMPSNVVYVADGTKPMDAALLGAVVGRATGMMLLAPGPLHQTGAAQASNFGLTGISRVFLIGPPAPVAPRPAAPSYPAPPRPTTGSLRGCAPGKRLLSLTAGNDVRNGTAGPDLIFGGAGNDRIDALAGDDCVDLGLGNDRGQGGAGKDLVLGGGGNDRILGNSGNDRLLGGVGRDSIFGGFGNDRIHGQGGNDRINGSRGRDRINGGSGKDRISGGSSNDRISGDAGSDRISGNSGRDVIKGNSGNDRINGGAGRDRISCGRGRDTVIAGRGDRIGRDCERVRRRR